MDDLPGAIAARADDLTALREQLVASRHLVDRNSSRLRAAYDQYRDHLGRHPGRVPGDIEALLTAVRDTGAAVRRVHVSSGEGRRARRLVLETLGALERGLVDLNHAYASRDKALAELAVSRAKASAEKCEELRVQASHALGWTWRL